MLDTTEINKITGIADELASADQRMNGDYINAPYKVSVDGERYIAYVRRTESAGEVRTYLEIMRPASHIANMTLERARRESASEESAGRRFPPLDLDANH